MKNFKYFTLVPNASSQHLQHRRVLRGLSGGGGGARHRCAPLPVGNAHVGAAGNEELDEVKVAAFDRCEERRRGGEGCGRFQLWAVPQRGAAPSSGCAPRSDERLAGSYRGLPDGRAPLLRVRSLGVFAELA